MKLIFLTAILLMVGSCHKYPEKNKVLRVNISREPTCFDPRKVFDPSHQMLISMLFEGLFKLEPDMSVAAAQVETYRVSSDHLTYTFHLGDHTWSDKSPVTADDFVQTYLDLLNPEFPAPHAHLLYDIAQAEEAKRGEVPLSVVGIKALNAKTLEITLKRPNPCFLQILASPYLAPICRHQENANPEWALKPPFVCNGNFTLTSWSPKAQLILKRNRHYSGRFPAKLSEIQMSLVANEMSAFHLYGNGYLDILGAPLSQIPLPYLKNLKEQNSLIIKPVSASLFIGFNTESPPFNNLHLRRALGLSINRQEIVEHITLLGEEAALSPIPTALKRHPTPEWIQDADDISARKELEKARAELPEKSLEHLTLYFWPMEINYLLAQTLQQQWRQALGLEIKIEVIDFKTLLSKVIDRSYSFAIFAWSADYADPISLLHRFRLSQDAMNYSHWHNERFSSLLDASALERDPEKRAAILQDAEKLLVDEMPIAPIFHWNFSLLIQPELKGFTMDPLGNIRFDKLSL